MPSPDNSTTGKHIPALDGIRGLAVLLVMYFHFMWGAPYTGHNPVMWLGAALKNMSWVGVDLFFVLSGFLITGILFDTQHSGRFFRNFYARRALRIFPLFYFALFGSVFLAWLLGSRVGWWGLLSTGAYVGNLAFPGAGAGSPILGPGGSFVTLNHFWSLSVEEQFYFLWPLAVFALKSRRKIAIAALLGIAASFGVRLWLTHTPYLGPNPYLITSWTPSRLDGLFFGAILAMLVRSRWEIFVLKWSWVGMLAGVSAMALLCVHYPWAFPLGYANAVPGVLDSTLLSLLFASMIAASLRSGTALNRAFSASGLRFFGRYSYGIYVYHYTISNVSEKLRPAVAHATGSKMLGIVLPALLGFATTVAISLASFHWFEAPFLRLKSRFEDRSRGPKLATYVTEGNGPQ